MFYTIILHDVMVELLSSSYSLPLCESQKVEVESYNISVTSIPPLIAEIQDLPLVDRSMARGVVSDHHSWYIARWSAE